MPLQDEISKEFVALSEKEVIHKARELAKKNPQSEKSLRELFVTYAAALFHNKELVIDDKPLLLVILEVLAKLYKLKKSNKEYQEQYAVYIIMSLANYVEHFTHELIPLDLFEQIPIKSIQLHVLAQPRLHADWTLEEIKALLAKLSTQLQPGDAGPLALAKINLAMRYYKASQIDNCQEQLLLLAKSSDMTSSAKDFVDYLRTEFKLEEIKAIVAMLLKTKALFAFYQQCLLRAVYYFQHDQTTEDKDFMLVFLTKNDAVLNQLLVDSAASADVKEDSSICLPPLPSHAPPPIPPPVKAKQPPVPPPRKPKPENKAKTMSKKAGRELLNALRKHSGYKEDSQAEITEMPSLMQLMSDAFAKRRPNLKEHDSDDDQNDTNWSSDEDQVIQAKKKTVIVDPAARPLPAASPSAAAEPLLTRQGSSATRPTVMTLFGSPPKEITPKQPALISPDAGKSSRRVEKKQ